jgi:hypothetical protein
VRRRVLLTLTFVVAAAACGADTDDGGAGAVEAMVLETCAPSRDPIEAEVCQCALDELQIRFDADALEELDRQLRDDPETIPPEVQEIVLDCGFERVSPPAPKPEESTTTSSTASTSSTSSSTSTTRRSP